MATLTTASPALNNRGQGSRHLLEASGRMGEALRSQVRRSDPTPSATMFGLIVTSSSESFAPRYQPGT